MIAGLASSADDNGDGNPILAILGPQSSSLLVWAAGLEPSQRGVDWVLPPRPLPQYSCFW